MLQIKIISLFPDYLSEYFNKGLFKKAQDNTLFSIETINLRDYAVDKHRKVDDAPFGGGHGMVLKVDVLSNALNDIPNLKNYHIIYPCPQGSLFTQKKATQLLNDSFRSDNKGLIFIVGYYEGLDERVFDLFKIQRISIGDFVLSSGELPSLMMIETIVRQLPGFLGNKDSLENDSLISGFLEEPYYTHPRDYKSKSVPEVLLSGHHNNIKNWKVEQQLMKTLYKRPSLLAKEDLSVSNKSLLTTLIMNELAHF